MEDLEVFKRRVGYHVQADQDTFTGNGSNLTVQLRHENVSQVDIYLGDELLDAELYTLDAAAGVVTFGEAPEDGVAVTIDYKFAPFTDEEAQALITEYGIDKAVIEALREILANQAKLRNYKQGDTEVDNSQVFKQVKQLLDMYQDEYQADQSAEQAGIAVVKRRDPRGDVGECREKDLSRLYG